MKENTFKGKQKNYSAFSIHSLYCGKFNLDNNQQRSDYELKKTRIIKANDCDTSHMMPDDTNIGVLKSPLIGDFLFESIYDCVAVSRHNHMCITVSRHKHMHIIAVGFSYIESGSLLSYPLT